MFEPSKVVYRNKSNKKCYIDCIPKLPVNKTIGSWGDFVVGYYASDMIMFVDKEAEDSYYNGMTSLSFEQKTILQNLTDEDNPILILYSIK